MATANPTQARSGAVAQAPAVEVSPVSRREFLYYIWGASIALMLGQVGVVIVWFALPRFREGEFGGVFTFPVSDLPAPGDAPVNVPAGRFHVSASPEGGLVALYGVCTHLGCLPKWEAVNVRFACPCHGSQFLVDGRYITGPAPRGLDRFPLTVVLADGSSRTNGTDGFPIDISDISADDIVEIRVDTGGRVNGPAHGAPYASSVG
ncbi:MAG: Rieske 2Fe-2S domain-containing protein [Anaerolineae bacterium]|jgi:cytochrome b6-f complex iron-sulfur subunit|nr:Rieske 2Fe-2S domain-containing protein [Anaerolineae bacterium]